MGPAGAGDVFPGARGGGGREVGAVVVVDDEGLPEVVAFSGEVGDIMKPGEGPQQGFVFPVPDIVSRTA